MGKLLFEIYEQIIGEGEEARGASNRIEKYVNGLIEEESDAESEEEKEKLKELIYAAAGKAEQEGFRLGVKFVLRLIYELFSETLED